LIHEAKRYCGLGVGIAMVFEILGDFLFKGDGTTIYGTDLDTIRFCLIRETRIYKVKEMDLNIFQKMGHFLCKGERVIMQGHDLHTIRSYFTQETRICMV
jgi:hypothetical protein